MIDFWIWAVVVLEQRPADPTDVRHISGFWFPEIFEISKTYHSFLIL